MKKILSFLMALVLVGMLHAQTVSTQKHEIQSGETLYSIARLYNVPVSVILELNPGLQADYIMSGQKINVPASAQHPVVAGQGTVQHPQTPARPTFKTKHEVKKKETIYSISRQYGITEKQLVDANPFLREGKLKKGTVLNIPYTEAENQQYAEQQRRMEEEAKKPKIQMYSTIKVAVILPFSRMEEKMSVESQKMTNLYQGFLLAVDSLKQRGYSVEIFAYDESGSDEAFNAMLNKPSMKDVHLIVGPMRPYHIASVANLAKENKIAHVVPLSNDLSLVNDRPTLFQINLPHSQLYNQVYNRFVVSHRNENIIFVSMNDRDDNMVYINDFKKTLSDMTIPYKMVSIAEIASIKDMLVASGRNVIIPSNGSLNAFETLCKKLDGMKIGEEYNVQLFGYPEWQTFAPKQNTNLSKYHCQFFSSFYSNAGASRTQQFNSRFRRWFNQDQYNGFPRYGELGYDIAAYFLKGLKEYGSAFYENIHSYSYSSLEFPLNFEKKNQTSGYQNRALFFVTYKTDGTVSVK